MAKLRWVALPDDPSPAGGEGRDPRGADEVEDAEPLEIRLADVGTVGIEVASSPPTGLALMGASGVHDHRSGPVPGLACAAST